MHESRHSFLCSMSLFNDFLAILFIFIFIFPRGCDWIGLAPKVNQDMKNPK
jgi:hypothetical protein